MHPVLRIRTQDPDQAKNLMADPDPISSWTAVTKGEKLTYFRISRNFEYNIGTYGHEICR